MFGPTPRGCPAQESFDAVVRGLPIDGTSSTMERCSPARRSAPDGGRHEGAEPRGSEAAAYVVDRAAEPPLLLRTVNEPNSNWEERLRILDGGAEPRPLRAQAARAARRRRRTLCCESAPRSSPPHRHADYDALAELSDPQKFRYTFGEEVDGGPGGVLAAGRCEREEPSPAEALSAILRLPYTLSHGLYVWPFAYDKTRTS